MEKWMDLKINRQLLDSDFEGYRLSLDKIAGYNIPLREELLIVNIPSHQYSLQHVKLFASHNHLIQERWNSNILYFISKDVKVYSVCNLPEENSLKGAANVFSLCDNLPSSITREGVEIDLYNPTLTFPSESLAVLCDGCGSFYILETGDRNLQQTWSVLHSETKEYGFSIYDSLSIESNEDSEKRIALVTGHIVENEGEKKGFRTVITRILLVCGSEGWWREESSEEFTAYNVEYVSLGAPDSLFVASQTYSFSPAADDSLASGDVSLKQSPGGDSGPAYVWLQADEDITVTFNLQGFQNLDKKEVNVIFSRNSITVSVQGRQLLCGDLFSPITASECTWTLADGNRRLEVYLTKSAGDWWSELVSGDSRGEMITDSDVADRIHENLSYLTTDTMENGDQSGRSAVNGQDLEECDLVEGDSTFLCKIPANSKRPSCVTNMTGYSWLFNRPPVLNLPAQLCTRHDVDGIVWSPSAGTDDPPTHTATHNALGYIQASKQNRRFISCPESQSYVAIADSEKHVYIYRQPQTIGTDMRNRKTGKSLAHVSMQQVISLDSGDTIYGLAATNNALYILTCNKLHKYKV